MDDTFLVGVLNGVADADEKLDTLAGSQAVDVAVVGDVYTLHQLHDEVWTAVLRHGAIEHLGDTRMVHDGQGLALGFEARHDLLRVKAGLHDLEGDPAGHRLALLGHVHDAHAALAEHLQDPVRADPVGVIGGRRRGMASLRLATAGGRLVLAARWVRLHPVTTHAFWRWMAR